MRSQTSENAPKIDFMTFSKESLPLIVKGGSMRLVEVFSAMCYN